MKSRLLFICIVNISLLSFGQNAYEVQPKQTNYNETKKELSEEEKFIDENFPFIHMADWRQGMRFMVETDKYAELGSRTELRFSKYKKSGPNAVRPLQKDYQGKIFTVINLEERLVSCPRGRCTRTYVVMECEGNKFEYEFIGSIDEMRQKDVFTTIDKLICIDEIDKARELLINKKLFFLKDPLSAHQTQFIPVTITNVGMGSTLLYGPIKIIYAVESGKEYEIELKLSGTNIYSGGGKKFNDVFRFNNPKNKYPEISEEIWKLIQNGKVRIGMTEKECELSWGKPEKINTTVLSSGKQEQWVYSASSYLYFDEGKLSSIQN